MENILEGYKDAKNPWCFRVLSYIFKVLHIYCNPFRISPNDGVVPQLHYRWTFFILILCSLLPNIYGPAYGWITCRSLFNAETQIPLDHLDICLSYPYIEENGSKSYFHFYKWTGLLLFFLACVYHAYGKVHRSFETIRTKKLLRDAANYAGVYDFRENNFPENVSRYMSVNLRTHNSLYWKILFINLLALAVDIFAFHYLDAILDGHFIQYGLKARLVISGYGNMTNYMTQTFPPFVSCELNPDHKLVNKRIERFGCHLTIMELYQKVFLVLWVWLLVLCLITCCYIAFLLSMWLPFVQKYGIFSTLRSVPENERTVIRNLVLKFKIGDIFLLYNLKCHLSSFQFYRLLNSLLDPDNTFGNKHEDISLSTLP